MDNLWIKMLDGELFIVKRPKSTFLNQPVKTNNNKLQIIIWTEI